jgi:hypothetical protein
MRAFFASVMVAGMAQKIRHLDGCESMDYACYSKNSIFGALNALELVKSVMRQYLCIISANFF